MELEIKHIYPKTTDMEFYYTRNFDLRRLSLNNYNSNEKLSVIILEDNDGCQTRYFKDFSSTKLEFSLHLEDAMILKDATFDSMIDIIQKGIVEGKEVDFYDVYENYIGEFVTKL